MKAQALVEGLNPQHIRQRNAICMAALPLPLMLLGFALRTYALHYRPLWIDEGYTAYLRARDVSQILSDIVPDHTPLHYVLLHYWTMIAGDSEFALRYVSVLFGVASLALVFAVSRAMFGRRVALAALLLASSSPFLVYWAQQARPTSTALFFSMLIIWMSFDGARRLASFRGGCQQTGAGLTLSFWSSWVVCCLLGLYSFYYVALLILPANAYFVASALIQRATRQLKLWVASQVAILALFLPWVLQHAGDLARYRDPSSSSAVTALDWAKPYAPRGELTAVPAGLWQIIRETWWSIASGELSGGGSIIAQQIERQVFLVSSAALLCLGVLALARAGSQKIITRGLLLALWTTVPIVLVVIVDQHGANFFPRHLISLAPAYYIVSAAAMLPVRRAQRSLSTVRLVVAGLLMGLATIGSVYYTVDYYSNPSYLRQDYRSLASYIARDAHPDDAIVLNVKWQYPTFSYYYKGGLPVFGLPAQHPIDVDETQQSLRDLTSTHSAVWMVSQATAMTDPDDLVEHWLDRNAFRVPYDRFFGDVRLSGFVPRLPDNFDPTTISRPTTVNIGGRVRLLGIDLPESRVSPGQTVAVRLYWQATDNIAEDLHVFVQLLDHVGSALLTQQDGWPLRGARPTSTWRKGEVFRDDYLLPIPQSAVGGVYDLVAGMYRPQTMERQPVLQDGIPILSRIASLGWVKVLQSDAAAGDRQQMLALDVNFGDQFRLIGDRVQNADDGQSRSVRVDLLWQSLSKQRADYTVFVQLVDSSGHLRGQVDEAPLAGRYPTSSWDAGEEINDVHILPVPSDLAPDTYDIIVGLYSSVTLRRLSVLPAANQQFVTLGHIIIPDPSEGRQPRFIN